MAAAAAPVPLTAAMLLSALVVCVSARGLSWPTSLLATLALRASAPLAECLFSLEPYWFAMVLRVLDAPALVIGRAVTGAMSSALVRSREAWPCGLVIEQMDTARAELTADRWDVAAFEVRGALLGELIASTQATDAVRCNLALAARDLGRLDRAAIVAQACADAIAATVPDPSLRGREDAAREAAQVVTGAMVRAAGLRDVAALVRDVLAIGGAS